MKTLMLLLLLFLLAVSFLKDLSDYKIFADSSEMPLVSLLLQPERN